MSLRARTIGYDRSSGDPYPQEELQGCDFVIVCVRTPAASDGAADLSQVRAALVELPEGPPVVLRSTVPPGTTLALMEETGREIIFWPEYVGEARFAAPTWPRLQTEHPFHVFGALRSPAFSAWIDFVAENYGPMAQICQVSPTEAELIKYMENTFFAVKTTFVNEFRALCEWMEQDWQSVREGWLLDPRIDRDHSDAFKSAPGFSGRCLPKDLSALVSHARSVGTAMPLLETVQEVNQARTE